MEIDKLFDKAVAEIERMLSTRTVVGEPIKAEGVTLIPLINVGFGFGVGGGKGTEPNKGSGEGGGTGGGGGVKPVAIVIITADGVRIEQIKSGTATVLEKVAESIGKVAAAKGSKESE
ncbi:MAG: spore germination protein GerW family protein [Gammaproteobacteria bacterium]|jgi:uncharacterized spore protein YtfJ